MPINVSNMIVNIGQTQSFEWGNFWTALFGAGFGALAAFGLKAFSEYYKTRKINITNLNILLEILASNLILFIELHKVINIIKNELSRSTQFASRRTYKAIIGTNWGTFDVKNLYFIIKNQPGVYSTVVKYFSLMQNLKEMINEYNNKVYKDKNADNIDAILDTMKNYIEKIEKQLLDCIFGSMANIKNIQLYGADYFKASDILQYEIQNEAVDIIEGKQDLYGWFRYESKHKKDKD